VIMETLADVLIFEEFAAFILSTAQVHLRHRCNVGMHSLYASAAAYLSKRLPLDYELLENLTYLLQAKSAIPASTKAVTCIVRKLPNIGDSNIAVIVDE
jgi:hypothetical protein